jgi:hypothetical protein
VVEVTKRIVLTVVLALALAGTAAASPSLRGVVVGSGNGVVFVAAPGGKVTMVAGHAKLGTRVLVSHGRLVVLGRLYHAAKVAITGTHVQLVNGVRRNDDEGQAAGPAKIEIEGVVAAVGTGTVTLNVGGQMLTVQLPSGVVIPASFVGRAVELELEFPAPVVAPGDDEDDDHGGVLTTPAPVPGHDDGDDHGGHGDGGGHGGPGRH